MIAIVDYGAGNLRSVERALAAVGARARVTSDPLDLPEADLVLLPGVGAAGDAMAQLAAQGLVEPLREVVQRGQPFLGVCLGLQLLFTYSEEGEGTRCLDLVAGSVRRFSQGLKVPHMGWNQVVPVYAGSNETAHPGQPSAASPDPERVEREGIVEGHPEPVEGRPAMAERLFDGIPAGSHFYFVHSYYGVPDDPSVVAATTEYGITFASVILRDNLIATQFHPEKSAALGLRFYANVLRYFGLAVH